MTQPARQLPDIEIKPIVPTKQELEWLEWQEKYRAMLLQYSLSVFGIFEELLNEALTIDESCSQSTTSQY